MLPKLSLQLAGAEPGLGSHILNRHWRFDIQLHHSDHLLRRKWQRSYLLQTSSLLIFCGIPNTFMMELICHRSGKIKPVALGNYM